jgi:hypothetical protein
MGAGIVVHAQGANTTTQLVDDSHCVEFLSGTSVVRVCARLHGVWLHATTTPSGITSLTTNLNTHHFATIDGRRVAEATQLVSFHNHTLSKEALLAELASRTRYQLTVGGGSCIVMFRPHEANGRIQFDRVGTVHTCSPG